MKRNWEYKNIEECLEKVTVVSKLQTKDFLSKGKFPIVSQEVDYISGYWNNDSDVVRLLHPVVVFGDHSRVVKYIDFDFVVGADGVKILSPKDFLNPKFLYYFVKSADIPSLGYSRHYKLLREKDVPVPPLSVQSRIVAELDLLTGIIDKQNAQLKELDNLAQAIFYDMFGDPIENPKKWPVKKLCELSSLITNGNTPKGGEQVYVDKGILFLRSQNVWKNYIDYDDVAYIDDATNAILKKSVLHHNDILITKTGRINTENSSLGRSALFDGETGTANINGHVYLVRLLKGISHTFVLRILISKAYREYIRKVCVGGIDKRQINKDHVEDFPIIVPPLALQQSFAEKIQSIEKQKETIRASIADTQKLLDYTMDKYFG